MGCGNCAKQIIHGCSGSLINTAKPHTWMMSLLPSPKSQRMEVKIGIIKAALCSQMSMASRAKSSPILWQTQLTLSNTFTSTVLLWWDHFTPFLSYPSAVWTLLYSASWTSKAMSAAHHQGCSRNLPFCNLYLDPSALLAGGFDRLRGMVWITQPTAPQVQEKRWQ